MRYHFDFSPKGGQDFSRLENKIQRRILLKLEAIEKTDQPLLIAKKLAGVKNTYRFRVGDYRVIVRPINEKTFIVLLILKVGHRKDVYDF